MVNLHIVIKKVINNGNVAKLVMFPAPARIPSRGSKLSCPEISLHPATARIPSCGYNKTNNKPYKYCLILVYTINKLTKRVL